MNPDIKTAKRVIEAVQLADIRLVKSDCEAAVTDGDDDQALRPTFQYRALPAGPITDGVFRVYSAIRVELASSTATSEVSEEAASDVALHLGFQLELSYYVQEGFEASEEELSAFARVNSVFNSWPYFRELVQSTAQRMGYSALLLPIYRVPQPSKEGPGETKEDESK